MHLNLILINFAAATSPRQIIHSFNTGTRNNFCTGGVKRLILISYLKSALKWMEIVKQNWFGFDSLKSCRQPKGPALTGGAFSILRRNKAIFVPRSNFIPTQ